ncbi:hypothetical protein VPHK449_0102 [Vibrio phage K449]
MAKNTAEKVKAKGFCLAGLKVDEERAKKGIWVPFMGGAELLIGRAGSVGYNKMISKGWKEHETALQDETPEAEALGQKLVAEATAEYELLGWRGVVDEEGNDLSYSKELAAEYLETDEIFEFVKKHANKRDHWRVSNVQDMGKN